MVQTLAAAAGRLTGFRFCLGGPDPRVERVPLGRTSHKRAGETRARGAPRARRAADFPDGQHPG